LTRPEMRWIGPYIYQNGRPLSYSLMGFDSSRDVDRLTGHEIRIFGCQKTHDFRHVFWLLEPAERRHGDVLLANLVLGQSPEFGLPPYLPFLHAGLNKAGTDTVDRNVVFSHL